jgi:hypothetical protein
MVEGSSFVQLSLRQIPAQSFTALKLQPPQGKDLAASTLFPQAYAEFCEELLPHSEKARGGPPYFRLLDCTCGVRGCLNRT